MNDRLTITRTFDAPVKTIWKYWSEPDYFKQWHGPKLFTCPVSRIDFRVGGKYLHCMRGSDALPPEFAGKDFWSTGTYKEIIPLKKIVATDSFADKDGNVVSPEAYGMSGFPKEMIITVEFKTKGNQTNMTLTHGDLTHVDEKLKQDMQQGWNESLDKLAAAVTQP